MAARAIGSATISFGLVSIPSKVYTTNKTGSSIRFRMMHPECPMPLKQQYIRPDTGDTVERSEMVKGYEFAKGQFVKLTNEEVKSLEAVGTGAIELAEFVPAEQVDPLYFEKSYYLGPDKGGARAYQLLREAMVDTNLVGIAKYATRGKQYTVVVRPFEDKGLMMHQLRYANEVKNFEEVPIDEAPEVAEAELGLAKQIIQQITSETFQPDKYSDEVKERVLELIDAKVEGKEITTAPQSAQGQVIDLMEALKASLAAGDGAAADTESTKGKGKKSSKSKASKEAKA